MNNPKKQNNNSRYVKLEDYKVFDYEIPEIFFTIEKSPLILFLITRSSFEFSHI